MQLPQNLQKFSKSTLLIVSDSIIAKIFLLGGDSLEELDSVAEPRELRQDSEGFFRSWDAARHGSPGSDIKDEPRLKHFAKEVADRVGKLARDHQIANIDLVMPTEVERLVSQHLPADVKSKILRIKHLDLMKEDPLEILRRLYE